MTDAEKLDYLIDLVKALSEAVITLSDLVEAHRCDGLPPLY
jgi:hypothetical protein